MSSRADLLEKLKTEMIRYYSGDRKRINHFLKVHSVARMIGMGEKMPCDELFILEATALVHDIGIKNSEIKYNSSSGNYQELEGPPEAEKMLVALGFEAAVIERVSYLVAHHHTYDNINALDYQALVEADFIVNMDEEDMENSAREQIIKKIFKTKSGIFAAQEIFKQDDKENGQQISIE